jgi:hypothetical protein
MQEIGKMLPMKGWQLFLNLANTLQSRLLPTTSTHSSMTGKNMQHNFHIDLLNDINILHFEK